MNSHQRRVYKRAALRYEALLGFHKFLLKKMRKVSIANTSLRSKAKVHNVIREIESLF